MLTLRKAHKHLYRQEKYHGTILLFLGWLEINKLKKKEEKRLLVLEK